MTKSNFNVMFSQEDYNIGSTVLMGFVFYKTVLIGMKATRLLDLSLEDERQLKPGSMLAFQASLMCGLYRYVSMPPFMGSSELGSLDEQFCLDHETKNFGETLAYLNKITTIDQAWLRVWDAQVEKQKVQPMPLSLPDPEDYMNLPMSEWVQLLVSFPIFESDTNSACLGLAETFQQCLPFMLKVPLFPDREARVRQEKMEKDGEF